MSSRFSRKKYDGPALFSYGFRPFFLAAGLFGLMAVPLWMLVYGGAVSLRGPFTPVDWHVHEMLFGYAAAVIAGFLFTAVPNWTGRMPARGWPLAALVTLWLAGRLAVAGVGGLPPGAVMLIDCGFLAAIAAMISVEIIAGRNWRNLKVVVPVLVLLGANAVFHVQAMTSGASGTGRRLGLSVVLFLIMLIGGRIIPSFTRNWLVRENPGAMPVPFDRFDGLCLLSAVAALALWTAFPFATVSGVGLVVVGILHAARLLRWRGWRTWRSPLLLMLHLAYGFLPVGLMALGLGVAGVVSRAAGLHLLGIGAIGGMTLAVMMRATLGHTGRALESGPLLTAAFAMIVLAALLRAALPFADTGLTGLAVAAAFWAAGFAIFAVKAGPWLACPNAARRTASR